MQCNYMISDSNQCRAYATKDSQYCFSHNPDLKDQKIDAVTRGGINRRLSQKYGEDIEIKSSDDVKELLADVINGVWTGKIPSNNPANTIGFLSRCYLEASEKAKYETLSEKSAHESVILYLPKKD